MENKDKLKIAITIASFTAISIILTTQFQKHRKHRKPQKHHQHSQSTPCYLKTETKPQGTFKRVLADNSYSPFKHLKLPSDDESDSYSNLHPYKSEISALLKSPMLGFVEFVDENAVSEMIDSYVWVETESQLKELAEVLSRERIFAVDTEQHSFRSFLGFTALIQISTKTGDYLVDTIALHDVMGILRPIFANPSVCKVFHGADNDVIWLQRDFHIYVVNLFDTAKACEVLSKPQKSLAYLLETYCGVATNKLLQREDWRQRPLPVEMVHYARTDAHYLLYITSRLARELHGHDSDRLDGKSNLFVEAIRRSNAICMQLFSKEVEAYPGESAASSLISRHLNDQGNLSSSPYDTKFQDIVRRVCAWRDLMARVHDESLRYVLSDHAVVALADKVPTSEPEICRAISEADFNIDSLNLSVSLSSPSDVVCSHLQDLCYLLQDQTGKLEDIFSLIFQKHLGPTGSCPLTIFNYALLSKTDLKVTDRLVPKQNGFKNTKQVARKASRELFVKKFSCKSPVYHNCRIYANDGRLLCYCDRRKLEWYLRRDLAKLVDENPPAIMLLFEPKGRPEDEDNDFYIQSKKNICVGCGEGKHYLRYRIIPSCYRIHFPEHLKSHRSHDIVLLCVDCHEIAHSAAEKFKTQVAKEFGIPLFIRKVFDSSQSQDISGSSAPSGDLVEAGVSPLELRTAAMALLRHGPRMPAKRREELTQIVMKYYGGREIADEDLERALIVGMSPHEKRRLEKKKGLSLTHSKVNIVPEKERKSCDGVGAACKSDIVGIHSTLTTNGEGDLLMTTDMDLSSLSVCYPHQLSDEVSSADVKNGQLGETEVSVLDFDTNSGSTFSSNGTSSSACINSDKIVSPKHNAKLSLLGHGPHGKLVVDHLLKEEGEDGIRQFCQRWRQVFVEAVHPCFLPAGWDVKHSGRRDFGEFSVYNPTKKVSHAAGDW